MTQRPPEAAHTGTLVRHADPVIRPPGRYMSRGPGRWQKQLLSAVSGTVVASVSGVVKTSRDDFTSARRAAKQLALAGQVAALYTHTCGRCYEIQDVEDPRNAAAPSGPCWLSSGRSAGS
jgi:hypothetical protein